MAEFESFARVPGFNPRAVVDTAGQVREQVSRELQQAQAVVNSNRIVDQQRIEDSRFVGQDLQALAPFAKSLGDYLNKTFKQTLKDKEIGDQFDAIYNNTAIPEEYAALIISDQEEKYLAQQANDLEAEGKINEAEALRNQSLSVSRGVRNEKALLTDARSRYASDILQLVNGKELAALYNANPTEALAIATKIWIKNNNLQYTTKANFVGILGETIRNTNSYVAQNAVSERIKQEKEQTLAENDRQAFNLPAKLTTDPTADFNELSDQYLFDNNGIVTRAAANQRAASMMFKGAESRGKNYVDAVAGIPIKQGEPKTTIGSTYPTLYYESQKAATDEAYKKILAKRKEETVTLAAQLKDITDLNERRRLINESLGRLSGDPEGQAALRDKFDDVLETQDNFNNYRQLQDQLSQGKVFTPTEIQEAVSTGKITIKRGNELLSQLDKTMKPGKDAYSNTVTNSKSFFNETFARKLGFSVAPGGIIDFLNIKGKVITKEKAKLIATQWNNALSAHLKQKMYELKYDGTQSPEDQRALLDKAAQEFYQKEVLSSSGRFYLGGLFAMPDWAGDDKQNYAGVQAAANQFGLSLPTRTPRTTGINNWSTDWNPASNNWQPLKDKYRAGDLVWTQQYTDSTVAGYRESGINDPELVRFASDMGVTPLQLITDQTVANKVAPLATLNDKQLSIAVGAKPNNIEKPQYKAAMWKGISPMLNAGFTAKGSAYLMALTYQLSRKNNIDYIREENFVQLLDQPLYQIFKNPYATDRQLGVAIQTLATNLKLDPYSYYSNDASSFLTSFYNQP